MRTRRAGFGCLVRSGPWRSPPRPRRDHREWIVKGGLRGRAIRLALQVMSTERAHQLLDRLARQPRSSRLVIQGSGIAGDPGYIPWLISQMQEQKTARLAGEAFGLITGLDLAGAASKPSGRKDSSPDPTTIPMIRTLTWTPTKVCLGLTSQKIEKWWAAKQQSFSTRYALLHGRARHARALHRCAQERLPAATNPRRSLLVPARSRHAAVQHQRAGMAAAAAACPDGVRRHRDTERESGL